MSKSITIRILGDASQFGKATQEVQGKLGGLTSKLGAVAGAVGGAFAVGKIVDFGQASINAAADDAKSQALLQRTLQNTIGARKADVASVENQISKWQTAVGVADDELRPAYGNLIRATHDTGEANKEMGIALDIAAAKGLDVETVTNAMSKAHMGNIGALKKLGVVTTDASGKTLTLDQVMQNANKTFGGSAKAAAETTAGKMAKLKVQFGELEEKIGGALIPVVGKLADFFLTKVLPAGQALVGWIEDHWPPVQQVITNVVGSIVAFVQEHWPQVQAVVSSVMSAVQAIISTVSSVIMGIWENFGSYVLSYIETVWDNIKVVVTAAINIVRGIIKVVTSLIHGDWSGVWDGIKGILSAAWDGIKGIVSNGIKQAGAILGAGWTAIKLVVSAAWDGLVSAITGYVELVKSIYVGIWDGLGAGLKGVVNGIISGFEWMINHIIDLMNDAINLYNDIPLAPDVDTIGHVHVPRLAKGGVVSSPTLALIGERGPEAVVPLSHFRGGGPAVNVTVQGSLISERDLIDKIAAALISRRRQGFAA